MTNHPNRKPTHARKLFLVCSHDGEDCFDLFVRAEYPKACVVIWRKYFGRTDFPERIVTVPDLAGPAGAVNWATLPAVAHVSPRTYGTCPECRHVGSDCRCHERNGGWIVYEPAS